MNGKIDSLVSSMDKLSSDSEPSSRKFPDNSSNDGTLRMNIHENENRNDTTLFSIDFNEKFQSNDPLSYKPNSNSNHQTNIHNVNHHHSHVYLNNEKKHKSYKLISDPILKKGGPKLYRYDGICSTNIVPKDPRQHVSLKRNLREPIDLVVPRFKIDKNYVGIPPSIEVSITNLNDNINKPFLEETLKKFGAIEEIEIFYHPKSKKHLGLAKVIFMTQTGAKACVNKLNQSSLMGNIINVFFDPFAKKIVEIYESIVNPPPCNPNSNHDGYLDPNLEKRLGKNSECAYDISTDYSNFTTPSSFETQSYFSGNQYFDQASQSWKINSSSNSDHNRSPVRESLDARLNNLFRQNKFLNDNQDLNMSLPPLLQNNDSCSYHGKNTLKKIDDSDAILGTPPSPFISASEYLKWHQVTKEVDCKNNNNLIENDYENYTQDTKKNNDDYDDDRMSLSSLNSEKFEDNQMANVFNANGHLSVAPELTNWNTETFNSSIFPQFVYHSFISNTSQPFGYFSGFAVPSSLRTSNDALSKKDENSLKDKNKISKSNKELLMEMLNETTQHSIKDLKEILRKDIGKKIVENFSFKIFDQWWEESERKSKSKDVSLETTTEEKSPTFRKTEIHIPFFNNPIFENSIQNRQNSLTSNFEYGVSRGLRAAMSKMPSFKRKSLKSKSPNRSIDDKLSDISDEDDYDNRKVASRRSRYRRNRSISSGSSSSPKRNVSGSSSSSSDSSSSSSSSSSASSSSSSEDEGSEDSSRSSAASSAEESEISESEEELEVSSKSSTVSKKSSVSSISSKLSLISDKISAEIDDKELMEPILVEETHESYASSTDTAEEAIEEMKKECSISEPVPMHDDLGSLDEMKKSKTREEFEASEALISLSQLSFSNEPSEKVEESHMNHAENFLKEHDYCGTVFDQKDEEPITVSKHSPKTDTVEKRKLKKKDIVDENAVPSVMAVASEWRKAKRKALPSRFIEDKINDENEKEIVTEIPPPITFIPRDFNSENEIIYEFQKIGIDTEDIGFLKRRYIQLLHEEYNNVPPWINDIHWVDHPATNIPTPRKRRKTDDPVTRIHQTGCARSEGYYKLDRKEKMDLIANIAGDEIEDANKLGAKQTVTTQQLTREARSNQRRLLFMAEQNSNFTELLKLNQLKFRKKQVKFARSKIHVWGLFAMQQIPQDEMVIEYIGQQIRPSVSDMREKRYGEGSSYFFKIDSETIIDATHCGNVARFINHSCNPNCYAKVITVEGQKRIVIYSKQVIDAGHEITYDYKFPIEEDNKIPCLCRTSQCRRYLN